MLEFEKKVLLTEQEYKQLFKYRCGYTSSNIQTNYYFDTDDFSMNKKGVTCRIRAKNGEFKATIKSHVGINTECSFEKDFDSKNEFDPNIFENMGLHLQGSLVTERIVLYKDNFCEMVLDRNVYLGYTDYELEVEYLEDHEQNAIRQIKCIAEDLLDAKVVTSAEKFLSRVGKTKSKSQRFFDRKLKLE